MIFSSLTFLYFFIPIAVISYFVIKNRTYRNWVLLILSLLFYSWGEPKFIINMLIATVIAYFGGLLMGDESKKKYKKLIFIISVVLITSNLLVFKYLGLLVSTASSLFGGNTTLYIPLPIGISFYTFQVLSYVIDLYKGQVKVQRNFAYLLLYVSFFPQLIAGPIVRYSTVEDEIINRRESLDDIVIGARRFILGLSKKVLLSNGLSKIANIIYTGNKDVYGSAMYWIAAISYGLMIYFDFSGYSDMAIGLGRIFGFHFLENFDHPYISHSISEFWRRWHISLSSWFRDYIYIPLGGNRVSKPRWLFNVMVVWATTGLWHGASWNFVLWGLYFGVIIVIEKLVLGKYLEKLPKFVSWLYTIILITIGWPMFNLVNFTELCDAFRIMFSFIPTNFIDVIAEDSTILQAFIYLPLGIICMLPLGEYIKKLNVKISSDADEIITNSCAIILLLLCIVFLISNKYNPFIYFRF